MTRLPISRFAALSAVLVATVLASGCATKKQVRLAVEPLEQRVSQLEAGAKKTDSAVDDLQTNLSATDERARGADSRAADAATAADKANQLAMQSGQQAESAGRTAGEARSQASSNKTQISSLDERLSNFDNFEMSSEEDVLFKFNSSTLTPEAKQQLEAAVAKIEQDKRYVIEVQGFTDPTGAAAYNKELSRKRADAVVQFLTVDHQVPLHRIFMHGAGEVTLTGAENTSKSRQESRRVEVRVYTPKLDQTATAIPSPDL